MKPVGQPFVFLVKDDVVNEAIVYNTSTKEYYLLSCLRAMTAPEIAKINHTM
jgi:hypothetical protein